MSNTDPVSSTLNNLRATVSRALSPQGYSGPHFDIYKSERAVIIESAPFDGLIASSISVEMSANELTISGNTEDKRTIATDTFMHRERSYGAFSRTFIISIPVDPTQATAKVRGGILTITLPIKVDDARSEVIDVQVADE
ncbi:MAG: Hsp20/alpha crystallin family protein [Chloroflexota bacterium]